MILPELLQMLLFVHTPAEKIGLEAGDDTYFIKIFFSRGHQKSWLDTAKEENRIQKSNNMKA
jgi:hypothetical protein